MSLPDFKSKLNLTPFQFPDPIIPESGAVPAGGMSKEDTIEFLADDDEDVLELETPPKSPKTPKEGKDEEKDEEIEVEEDDEDEDEEDDELIEIEKELEGPTDEELELVTPVRRKEILKKYPQLFKEFPYLEKAYYREQQFTELLPTIDDARVAVKKAQVLDNFERDVIEGANITTILKAVHEENPESFHKIADNYMKTLAEVDEKAYYHVLGNISKFTIMSMVEEGKRSKNDALLAAAQIMNQFIFGSSEFQPPTSLSKNSNNEDKKKTDEVNQREQQFIRQSLDTTIRDLNSKVSNTLKNTIESHIDPKKSMTDYVRRNASRDAIDTLENLISKDGRFKSLTDKLWEKAIESNFSPDSVNRIKSAYLAKAKTLLPSVIKKARNEALRGIGKRVKDTDDTTDESPRQGPAKVGKPRSNTPSGKVTKSSEIPKDMKTLDFLMED